MLKTVTQGLLLTVVLFGLACGSAKFGGSGKKKDKNADVTVVDPPSKDPTLKPTPTQTETPSTSTPTPKPSCNPGETCVVVDECKDGKAADKGKDCPVPCKDDGTNQSSQNPGKTCDDPTQSPGQSK